MFKTSHKTVANKPNSERRTFENQPKIARPALPPVPPDTFNFLLVGQYNNLADSIIIAAVDSNKQKVTLISIPRDLFINGRKMSEYLSWYGIDVLKEKIEAVSGLKIHKYAVINFQAFENIIDALGGVDIYVEKDITDPQYPDGAAGVTLYAVKSGSHHFSGAEALKYSRSRHSTSDFDRAKRQQKVLKAIQERVINFDFLKNTDGLRAIYKNVFNMVKTDIPFSETIEYLAQFQNFAVSGGNVISTADFLDSSITVSGQYILLPKSGSFNKVKKYIIVISHEFAE
ncbi:LCP family protein [Candidatus Peregrinibacteria bacterium]|nr:LCP family protein [Candidatus Peregrinibacteria bacterium]